MIRPKNESETHFLLKEIGKYILFGWGYFVIGTEVGSMHSADMKNTKNIIDVVGIKKMRKKKKGYGYVEYYDIKGIESKASLADYKNGFCAAPAYTYIIAPIGTIPLNLIPDKIGFIEVDLENFSMKRNDSTIPGMIGVELVKKAKKRIDKRFKDEQSYRQWCKDQIYSIAYRCSQELLYWRNVIEFSGKNNSKKKKKRSKKILRR